MTVHHQVGDPEPGDGAEPAEGVFGHRMFEVVRPSALDLVEPGQRSSVVGLGQLAGQ